MDTPSKKITDAYASIVERKSFKPLTEASLQHILGKKHSGYFIISECRSDWVQQELEKIGITSEEELEKRIGEIDKRKLSPSYWNALRSKELESDLRSLKLGYIPVFGGFVEKSEEHPNGVHVFEKSYFIPYRSNAERSFSDVKDEVFALGKKYRQQSITVCPPEEAPYFLVCTKYPGEDDVGTEQRYFGKDYAVNDLAKEYFTALNKSSAWADGEFSKKQPRRFSFESTCESISVAGDPMSYQEAYSRRMCGEIFAGPYPSAI